jgi:hypothetical protein
MSDVKIISKDPITGVLSIGISRPPRFVSGIDLLVQIVTIELLHSPGRDVLEPDTGANLRSLIGSNIAFDDEAEIFAEIKLMVQAAENNIKKTQASSSRPANEQLAKLELMDVVPDEESLQLEIIIRVTSLDQQSTDAVVGLK